MAGYFFYKKSTFKEQKKQIFHTLITTYGLLPNEHSIGLIDSVVTMVDLFIDVMGVMDLGI